MLKGYIMSKKAAFTLAEVLITLAVIGIIAALSLPSVVANTQQHEFKTGLKKAVSVLNSAIAMNISVNNESPYENADLFNYLQRHMSIMKTVSKLPWWTYYKKWDGGTYNSEANGAFYTTDGMRFEFDDERNVDQNANVQNAGLLKLHESDKHACFASVNPVDGDQGGFIVACGGCGSLGLGKNPKKTKKVPCAILVDVNGDRKPTPSKVYDNIDDATSNVNQGSKIEEYWIPNLETKRVSDIFVILITEDRAIPYGIVAQKAMYGAQK